MLDLTRVANVRNLVPYFNRKNRHDLDYEYDASLRMFLPKENAFVLDMSTLPRVMTEFIANKRSPPGFGDAIRVELQRRSRDDRSQLSIAPGVTFAIVCVESYNTGSRVYEVEIDTQVFHLELCPAYMLMIDNPDRETIVRFPRLFEEEEGGGMHEDALLIHQLLRDESKQPAVQKIRSGFRWSR